MAKIAFVANTPAGKPRGDFFRIRDAYYSRAAILMVKCARKPVVGRDDVPRQWVVTLTADASPDPKYRNVWATRQEVEPLLEMLERECGVLPTAAVAEKSEEAAKVSQTLGEF